MFPTKMFFIVLFLCPFGLILLTGAVEGLMPPGTPWNLRSGVKREGLEPGRPTDQITPAVYHAPTRANQKSSPQVVLFRSGVVGTRFEGSSAYNWIPKDSIDTLAGRY